MYPKYKTDQWKEIGCKGLGKKVREGRESGEKLDRGSIDVEIYLFIHISIMSLYMHVNILLITYLSLYTYMPYF